MSLLNSKSSIWPTVFVVILTAGLTLLLSSQISTCNQARPTGQAPDSIMYWRNEANKAVASLRGAVEDFGVQNQRITDSIARLYTAKFKELKEYIIADIRTHANIPVVPGSTQVDHHPPVVINQDTCPPQIRNIRATFESPYYFANAQLGEDPYLDLIGFDTLTVVWKDTTIGGLFNKKRYLQLDLSMANPDTKVTGLRAYRVPVPPPKKWGLGFSFGYGATIDRRTRQVIMGPQVGISVTKTLVRF